VSLERHCAFLAAFSGSWWVAGGWALDLHGAEGTRRHRPHEWRTHRVPAQRGRGRSLGVSPQRENFAASSCSRPPFAGRHAVLVPASRALYKAKQPSLSIARTSTVRCRRWTMQREAGSRRHWKSVTRGTTGFAGC